MIVRVAVSILGVLLVLIGLALVSGRGEDPYQAFTAYMRYLPGSPVPGDVTCQAMGEYPGAYGDVCTLVRVPRCDRGYLIVRQRVITYARLVGCEFPAAYLIAAYGRPPRIRRYRRVVLLVWEGMSAQVRRTGWFTAMDPVSSGGWW